MSNYTKSTNFATKDNLTPGDPLKIVRGTEIDTEFNNIATAIATKTDNASAAITGGTINDTTIGATTASTGAFTTLGATGVATFSAGTAGAPAITTTGDTNTGIFFPAADTIAFSEGGTEAMRIDSAANVGIGTTSPASKLDVSSSAEIARFRTSTARGSGNGYFGIYDTTGRKGYYGYGASDDSLYIANEMNAPMLFITNSAERARIDSSGNMGLGVTPSAWGFGGNLELPATNNISFKGSYGNILSNAYYDLSQSRWEYTTNDYAAQYQIGSSGQHIWLTAPSGTAGNAISFTQAMTLDASGNLGIGATSTVAKLDVRGTGYFETSTNPTNGVVATLTNQTTTSNNGAKLVFDAYNIGTVSVGIPTNDAAIAFYTGTTTERARIDSSGNLLVGTTTAGGEGWTLYPTGSGGGVLTVWNRPTTASTTTALEFRDGGTAKGSITYTNTATAFNTSSDYRLKNTIAPMTGALAKVALLKPVTYKWNADGSDGQGFIAHELAEVCPDAVTGEKDGTRIEQYEISPAVAATYDEDGNELTSAIEAVMGEREVPQYQGIDVSFLVATLTAAIQELKAEFDAYKASHP